MHYLKTIRIVLLAASFLFFPHWPRLSAQPLIFAGNQEYPPLVFLENGKPRGIYPDIIRAMHFDGLEPEIRLMPWQAAQKAVLEGSADLIIGMAILPGRQEQFDFSYSILPHEFAIFTRHGDLSVQSFGDLRFKTSGVIAGSVPVVMLKGDPEIRFKTITSYLEGFRFLKEGKVDALILNEWVAAYTIYHHNIEGINPVTVASVIGGPAAFGTRKGNQAVLEKINRELKTLKDSGRLDEIIERWTPQRMVILPQSKVRMAKLVIAGSVLLLILLFLILWVFMLRKNLRETRAGERKLKESHELLGKLTSHIPAMIYQFRMSAGGEFSLSYVSDGVKVMQELTPEQAIADFSLLSRRVHPDDQDRFLASILTSAQNLTPWKLEYRVILPKQGICWRHGESNPEKLPDGGIVWYGYLLDITDQKIKETQISELSAKIINLREKEQAEISHELHDSAGQNLILLKMGLQAKINSLPDAEKNGFGDFFNSIDQVLKTIRGISRRLSPLHLSSLGIVLAVQDICDQIRKSRNFKISVEMDEFARFVTTDMNIQVYRIVQEALTNVLKHSNADEIRIFTESGEQSISLVIADNGRSSGENTAAPSIGLQIMRERSRSIGGILNFSLTQNGARVTLELPKRLPQNA